MESVGSTSGNAVECHKRWGGCRRAAGTCLIWAKCELCLTKGVVWGARGQAFVRNEDLRRASRVAAACQAASNLLCAHGERKGEHTEKPDTRFEHDVVECLVWNLIFFAALCTIAAARRRRRRRRRRRQQQQQQERAMEEVQGGGGCEKPRTDDAPQKGPKKTPQSSTLYR